MMIIILNHNCNIRRSGTVSNKWATSWQNQQNDLCAQRRLKSAWASAQSDQSLRCPHEETLGHLLHIERTMKTLFTLGGCPGWSECSLCAKLIWLIFSWGGSNYCRCNFKLLRSLSTKRNAYLHPAQNMEFIFDFAPDCCSVRWLAMIVMLKDASDTCLFKHTYYIYCINNLLLWRCPSCFSLKDWLTTLSKPVTQMLVNVLTLQNNNPKSFVIQNFLPDYSYF